MKRNIFLLLCGCLLAACQSQVNVSQTSKLDESSTSAVGQGSTSQTSSASTEVSSSAILEKTEADLKNESDSSTTQMNLTEIQHNNFSSIEGNWRYPKSGQTDLSFTSQEFVLYGPDGASSAHRLESANIEETGILIANVRSGFSGFGMMFIPAGQSLTQYFDTEVVDQSDKSKDRILAGQNLPDQNLTTAHFMYRESEISEVALTSSSSDDYKVEILQIPSDDGQLVDAYGQAFRDGFYRNTASAAGEPVSTVFQLSKGYVTDKTLILAEADAASFLAWIREIAPDGRTKNGLQSNYDYWKENVSTE